MGLFSSSQKVSVTSTLFNLAGDYSERTNYLKTTVVGSLLKEKSHKNYLGEHIVNAHLNGPGMSQRSFYRWSRANFPLGTPTAVIGSKKPVTADKVRPYLSVAADEYAQVEAAFITDADFSYIAEDYLTTNNPSKIGTDWTADINYDTNQIIIQHVDMSTETIPAGDYDKDSDYLIAYYRTLKDDYDGGITPGTRGTLSTTKPDTTDYTFVSETLQSTEVITTTESTHIKREFSNGSPTTEETNDVNTNHNYDYTEEIWFREVYRGQEDPNEDRLVVDKLTLSIEKKHFIQVIVDDPVVTTIDHGTYIETVTTTVTRQVIKPAWNKQLITQKSYVREVNDAYKMLIYKIGSGITDLDELVTEVGTLTEFFPFIPVRLNNKAINEEPYKSSIYDDCAKAFKKATKSKIDDILSSIDENEDVDDIDHAYVVYGVPLNVKNKAGKKYLYEFFKSLIPYQKTTKAEYDNWLSNASNKSLLDSLLAEWLDAQRNPSNPLFGTAMPDFSSISTPEISTIRIKADDATVKSYDIRISWITIGESNHTGLGKAGAKSGDIWTNKPPTDSHTISVFGGDRNVSVETLEIINQTGDNTYEKITAIGLFHRNFVYNSHSVDTSVTEALDDTGESGFLIPLHYPTILKMSLVDSTQLTFENMFIQINAYEVVTIPWWQSWFFQIFLVIAFAIASVFIPGLGAVGGILGSNLAIGTALGFSGITALIVGSVANALAAMILTQLLSKGLTAAFGEKIGAVLSIVLGFFIGQAMANFNATGSFSLDWGSMMRAENIMQLTSVAVDAISAWLSGDTAEIYAQIGLETEKYEDRMEEINDLMRELGFGGGFIDPLMFIDVDINTEFFHEPPDVFMQRTLLTGNDVAEMSFDMIYDYTDINLDLPLRT